MASFEDQGLEVGIFNLEDQDQMRTSRENPNFPTALALLHSAIPFLFLLQPLLLPPTPLPQGSVAQGTKLIELYCPDQMVLEMVGDCRPWQHSLRYLKLHRVVTLLSRH